MNRSKITESSHLYAFITIFFWALAYVFTRLALQYVTPLPLGTLRYLIASASLLLFFLFKKTELPQRKDLPLFLLGGLSGFFLYMVTFNKGSETVTAATSSLIISTVPVLTALFARFLFKEKLQALQWLSIGLQFCGILVLTAGSGSLRADGREGFLWLIGASLCLSAYNLLQRKLAGRYTSVQSASFSIFAGTLMLCLFLPQTAREVPSIPPAGWFYIAALGVFSSAVAYISWAKAFSLAEKTSTVSNYMFITPLLTAVLGFLIAKEVPDLATLAGGAVILGGAWLFTKGKQKDA